MKTNTVKYSNVNSEIMNKTQTIVLTKTSTVIKCCAIVLIIAFVVSTAGSMNIREFAHNILDWQSF